MLKSKAFDGKSTIQAHRMVNKEIKDVIQDIHGLQVCVRVDMDLCLLNSLTCCDVAKDGRWFELRPKLWACSFHVINPLPSTDVTLEPILTCAYIHGA